MSMPPELVALLQRLSSLYPPLMAFVSKPGVLQVLQQAADAGWTQAEVQSHLEQTDYWKNTTDAARQWDMLRATDPATAQQKWDTQWQHVADLRYKLGVPIDDNTFTWIATCAIQNGWTDQTITRSMLGKAGGGKLPAGGDLGAALTQVHGLAADYGVHMGDAAALNHATGLLTGAHDAAGLADYFRGWAQKRWGDNKDLVAALDRGMTVKQYADPYMQMAAQELGLNPATIDLTKAKWSRMLDETDPKTGAPMSLLQWQSTIRQDPRYGYNQTAGAADQAAQLTAALAKEFGATG